MCILFLISTQNTWSIGLCKINFNEIVNLWRLRLCFHSSVICNLLYCDLHVDVMMYDHDCMNICIFSKYSMEKFD